METNIAKVAIQALQGLTPRQRDVIQLRYGLKGGAGLTLAAIGKKYDVTRERIRQIESQALKALKARFELPEFSTFRTAAARYLESFDGVRRHDLASADWKDSGNALRRAFEASGIGTFKIEDKDHYAFWSLSDQHAKTAHAVAQDLASTLRKSGTRAMGLPTDPKVRNCISISKRFAMSPHGEFGLAEWRDINPRVSRDWAFLVLKKAAKPLHFSEITTAINRVRPKKRVNPQTIYNELIKDKRFVLVGRGMYGLNEFGILPGTAREVLAHLLKSHGPKKAKDIVKLALSHRPFKEKTLLINLQNKNWFKKNGDGEYVVRKA